MDVGIFSPYVEVIRRLSSLLDNKADFGIRLKAAYDRKDRETLAAMQKECDVILEKLAALRHAHRTAWMLSCKPFGWEVHDIRYGGLSNRFDTVKERLAAYLDCTVDRIEELEAQRLRLDGKSESAPAIDDMFFWRGYSSITSASAI